MGNRCPCGEPISDTFKHCWKYFAGLHDENGKPTARVDTKPNGVENMANDVSDGEMVKEVLSELKGASGEVIKFLESILMQVSESKMMPAIAKIYMQLYKSLQSEGFSKDESFAILLGLNNGMYKQIESMSGKMKGAGKK